MKLEKIKDIFTKPFTLKEVVLSGLIVNQLCMGFIAPIGSLFSKMWVSEMRIEEKKLDQYSNLPANLTTQDYLNISRAIVHNYSSKKINKDCKNYAVSTHDVYSKLVQLNKREDLKKDVQVAIGMQDNWGHMMLQFKDSENSKSEFYETAVNITGLPRPEYVGLYSINRKKIDSRPSESKLDAVFAKTKGEGKILYPTLESFVYPGGVVRVFYNTVDYIYHGRP